ncbi:CDGSH iron-sulfur domain-containing protein 2 [Mactra antiquata]
MLSSDTEWSRILPYAGMVSLLAYIGYKTYKDGKCEAPVNRKIKKDQAKVADSVDIEDLGDKKVFCRCWKSDSFPYCDGSHNKHNQDACDNVGPLIIKKKEPAKN